MGHAVHLGGSMLDERLARIFNQQRWIDILTAKAAVMWVLLFVAEVTNFAQTYPQFVGAGWVLTCLTTTGMVLLRINAGNDAFRRGYKTAVEDIRNADPDTTVRVLQRKR